ncbi:MAG: polysaccharide biosynthesis/export family protein [Proteobacteria bacterium]|nr:polysaccharide biosynthesis/export family protein [Pseudomonadota bacterium]
MSSAHKNICIAAVLLVSSACSSTRPGPHQTPLPGPAPSREQVTLPKQDEAQQLAELERIQQESSRTLTLGRGDVINISVYDEADLTISGIPIRPDGRITFPLAGDIQAEGLTVGQLSDSLTEALSKYILTPKVSVIVQEFNSQHYTIFGEVVHPGVFPLKTDVSITEALAVAGGLNKGQFRATSVELADLNHAFIARNGKVLPVDFVRLIRQGDLRYDISLQSGDYIYIPSGLSQEVYILGEVNKPMLFAYREDMPMSRTLAQAEGFTPDADLKRIHIIRGALHNPTVIMINFHEVLKGRAREVPLEPGDIVYVPPTGLTSFARIMDKITPSIQAIQTGLILRDTVRD